ncbi:MAG: hypothetical protein L0H79_03220 [Intrasporangium sp.]|uniref:hypothetical protein n=1 Tax=Intrasporangium sp. TaxID=1925024 RepID=UPI0026478D62|nr:hypothetical protein [Intrasporangium sp.]MDN5794746.1 hypothetical protein [Intrasporangium sp.]
MNTPWLALVISSTAATLCAAPFVRALMLHVGVVDVPNHRSSHLQPTPRGGGIACALGVLSGTATGALGGWQVPYAAIAGAVLLAFVGFADDCRTIDPLPRLLAQVIIGGLVGWTIDDAWLGITALVLFPTVINAINFMDGINGITGMTMSVWGATMAYLGDRNAAQSLTLIGLVTIGSSVAFLPFNAIKAKMFLGDVGSYLYGTLCAAGILIGILERVALPLLLAPLALYFVDVFLTLVRRLFAGESLTMAHREHVYQQLTARGLTHLHVAAIVGLSSALISMAWLLLSSPAAVLLTATVVVAYVLLPTARAKFQPEDG